MADRCHLTIPAGKDATHRLEWDAKTSGVLEWSVIVHGDGLTVDLEVSAEISHVLPNDAKPHEATGKSELDEGVPSLVLLQEVTRGRNFRGTFEPADDGRLAHPPNGGQLKVDAIIFDFGNSFSWWTGKDVEVITLCGRRGKPSDVPPLPLVRPQSPFRSRSFENRSVAGSDRAPAMGSGTGPATRDSEGIMLAAKLGAYLAASQAFIPRRLNGGAVAWGKEECEAESAAANDAERCWLAEYHRHCELLRGLCTQVLQ